MLFDVVDRVTVEKMVRQFYETIIKDDLVGPFFIRALGNDFKSYEWHEHLNTLNNFWLMMMNGEKNYWGSPFPPHAFLGYLSPETFQRWLKLFRETVDELFIPQIADKFYVKGEVLANQFQEYLQDEDEDDE